MRLFLLELPLPSLGLFRMVLVLAPHCLVCTIACPFVCVSLLFILAFSCLILCLLLIRLGDLRTDIKKITDNFFAPGSDVAIFLNAFVRGEVTLPVTTGPIRGLPRAWRRSFGKPADTRPSLLFLDLPDPSVPDTASRNLAAGSILDMVKENNRPVIPVFGVSGTFCIKTAMPCAHGI